jgi:SSS family transporter
MQKGGSALSILDWSVFAAYLVITAAIGFWSGRHHRTTEDYFLGARRIPWWAAMLSLVATETSAVTVVAIPAMVFAPGGNFGFLQCAIGFAIGKALIARFILPAYFKRQITTPYEFLGDRLGSAGQRAGALLFMTALFVGAAFRIYVGAIPINEATALSLRTSLLIISVLAVAYTLMGGLRAVIYTDVFQMLLFLGGGAIALVCILQRLPNGWESFLSEARAADKLMLFDWGFRGTGAGGWRYDWTVAHTVFAGFIGATFVTLATHGTDHSNLQRLLACNSLRSARLALVVSAFVVFLQFALFLAVGAALYAFYHIKNTTPSLADPNAVLPHFVVTELPRGLPGLLIAGIFAAAMSTVDSALSALSASTMRDWRKRGKVEETADHGLASARWSVLVWGLLLYFGAEGASKLGKGDLIGAIFTAANSLYGPLLGVFSIALVLHREKEKPSGLFSAIWIPLAIGMAVQVAFFLLGQQWFIEALSIEEWRFNLAWPWVTLVGASATFLPALLLHRFGTRRN